MNYNIKISELLNSGSLEKADIFPIVRNGRNYVATGQDVIDLVNDSSIIDELSSAWQSTYTTVYANSASWDTAGSAGSDVGVRALTGNWQSTYTTVYANSANWDAAFGSAGSDVGVRALTGNWQSTYTAFSALSAKNDSVYTTVRSASANYILDGGNTKGSNILIGTNDAFDLSLETNGLSRLTILSSGNVGIGITSPNEKLTVSGNISASGNIAAQSSTVPVTVTDALANKTFSDVDTNKVFHFSTSSPLTAIFPSTLSDGFSVALMNTGTSTLHLSTNITYKATGNVITDQYAGAYVYKANSELFVVGGL